MAKLPAEDNSGDAIDNGDDIVLHGAGPVFYSTGALREILEGE